MKNLTAAAVFLAVALAAASAEAQPRVDYVFKGDLVLGAPNFWDYLTYDPAGRRLYASHVNKLSVVDVTTGKLVGEVGPFHDAHGVAIVDGLGKGYADSGEDAVLKVFDLKDLKIIKEIKVSDDADGVVYDPSSGRVLVVAGDSRDLTLVDPKTDAVVKVIDLHGKPEFMALDGHGSAFVNLADINAVAKVDLASGEVRETWPLQDCKTPHGLGYDPRSKRLFSGCANGRMAVLDATSGANIANLPIGGESDGVVVDPARGLVFSSNGDGTLSVISERGGVYEVARTIPTFFGGRNIAIDPVTGRLFISHGNMVLASPRTDVLALKFAWDGLDIATFDPSE
jgi:DNA-binding beta-propeller fold protein YncE